jgi:hypothetical protein
MREYLNWAKTQLSSDHEPSAYDWDNMPMSEMAERALAICTAAREAPSAEYGDYLPIIFAFQSLEKMAEAIKYRYEPRPRAW